MRLHEINPWEVYECRRCTQSNPPKDKCVVVVAKQGNKAFGFFINSKPHPLAAKNPKMAATQVLIRPDGYPRLLKHDSYVGCNSLLDFFDSELNRRIVALNVETKESILASVAGSVTLTDEQKALIARFA